VRALGQVGAQLARERGQRVAAHDHQAVPQAGRRAAGSAHGQRDGVDQPALRGGVSTHAQRTRMLSMQCLAQILRMSRQFQTGKALARHTGVPQGGRGAPGSQPGRQRVPLARPAPRALHPIWRPQGRALCRAPGARPPPAPPRAASWRRPARPAACRRPRPRPRRRRDPHRARGRQRP